MAPNLADFLSSSGIGEPSRFLDGNEEEPQFLVAALEHFKLNEPESYEALAALAEPYLRSAMRAMLRAGKRHEEALLREYDKEMPKMKLLKSHDKRNELGFVPYRKAGEAVRRCIKEFLPALPKFDGGLTAEQYAKECKSLVKTELDARRDYVRPFLSKYHLHYLRKQFSAKTSTVLKDQKNVAELWLASHSPSNVLPAPQPAVPSSTVLGSLNVPLNEHEPPCYMHVLPLSFSAVHRRSLHPVSISMNEPKTNFPVTPNPIRTPSPQSVPLAVDSGMTENDRLLTNAFEFVNENCGNDFRWLQQHAAGSSSMSSLQCAIRAYRFGEQQECDCSPHRRVVETLQVWVLEAVQNAPDHAYNMAEIEVEAAISGETTREQSEVLAINAIVSEVVQKKVTDVLKRRQVLLSFMSQDDLSVLNRKIKHQRDHLRTTEWERALSIYCHGLQERSSRLEAKNPAGFDS